MQNNDKIEIRNGGFKTTDLLYLGGSGIFVILSPTEPDKLIRNLAILVFGSMFIYFSYQVFKRIRDKTVKVEISESGIMIFEMNLFIPWSKISAVEIIRGKGSYFDLLVYYLQLTVETKTSIVTRSISLEEYNVDKKKILLICNRYIEKYFDKEKNEYCC